MRLATALALGLALSSPASAMRYGADDLPSRNVIDLRGQTIMPFSRPLYGDLYGPAFPADIMTCGPEDTPGVHCNCVGGDEDACTRVPWTECFGDMDCEIKSRSPYGWKPKR